MPVTYDGLMSLRSDGDVFTYGDRETMLYALGVGMGRDPMNEDELRYVYENDLKTLPTLASVIAWGQRTIGQAGINYLMVVHGEQRLTMHKPLPSAAEGHSPERHEREALYGRRHDFREGRRRVRRTFDRRAGAASYP
jgi:hypothetical protein